MLFRSYASGGLRNISGSGFTAFADGNVYATQNDGCVKQFDMAANGYISPAFLCGSGATNDWTAFCAGGGAGSGTGPCLAGSRPGLPRQDRMYTTPGGASYVGATNGIVRIYPSLAAITTTVNAPTLISGVGSNVVVTGTSAANDQLLVEVNVDTSTTSVLSGPSEPVGEVEYYHLLPSSDGTILFDGLQFSTNQYVIGRVDPAARTVTILSSGTGRLSDFQTF